jgi:hypothetical protein
MISILQKRGAVMSYSIGTADRATHLKVLVVALIWATVVMGVAITIR